MVEFRYPQFVLDPYGLHFGQYRDARVALLHPAAVPVLLVPLRHVFLDPPLNQLFIVSLDLVKTQNVGILLVYELLEQALGEDRVNAVDVP